jgi:hypothetical protein
MRRSFSVAGLGLGALLALAPAAAPAATEVVFVSGAFRRSIPVADLEHLAATGEARGLLADLIRFGRQKPAQVAGLLNISIPLPLVPTSRFLSSAPGTAILERVGRILFPLKAPGEALPALRAATINGLVSGNGSISPVGFLRAYPNDDLAVSLPALRAAMNQVEAMSGVVKGLLDTDIKPNVK